MNSGDCHAWRDSRGMPVAPTWLPPGFEFLCGLDTGARLRRKIMPVHAFVDDSGGKGQSRHFVLAGLVSDSARWSAFSEDWRACLEQHPRIPVFKMREAAACSGAFRIFSPSQRDDRLRSFAQIINRYVEFAIWSVVDLEAHAETWAKFVKPQSEVYFWPFHTLIMGTCFDLWEECNWRERFEIIFDEQKIFGERARAWYPIVREVMRQKHPEESQILPIDPLFRKDDEFLPIQAADLWAWCIRKNTDDPSADSFNWLLSEMTNVSRSCYCNYFDLERISRIQAQRHRQPAHELEGHEERRVRGPNSWQQNIKSYI